MRGTTHIPEVSVLIRKGDKILFVLRTNTGWMDGFYALPGGHLEADENFTNAGVREAHEEVGITIGPTISSRCTRYSVLPNLARCALACCLKPPSGPASHVIWSLNAMATYFGLTRIASHTIKLFRSKQQPRNRFKAAITIVKWAGNNVRPRWSLQIQPKSCTLS